MRRRRIVDDAGTRGLLARSDDDEWHAGGLVVEVEPLLVQSAVRPEEIAVVRRADQHGVRRVSVGHRSAHPIDRAVRRQVQPVVQVPVRLGVVAIGPLDDRRRPIRRRIRGPERDLGRGLRSQILVVGRRGGNVGWIVGVANERIVGTDPAQPRGRVDDVVGVDEADDQQERPQRRLVTGPTSGVAILEPRHRPVRVDRIAHETRERRIGAVRFGPDPAREPEVVERVGVEIRLDRALVERSVNVVRCQRAARVRVDDVGVGHVPLAHVLGVVPAGTEPVTERRHLVRAKPAHTGVVVHLAQTVGLGDPVDIGILAGEQGRATGHTCQGARVVAPERHPMLLEPPGAGELLAAPRRHLRRLVGWRGAFLVGHQHDDIGTSSHGPTSSDWASSRWALRPASIWTDALPITLPMARATKC